MIRYVVSEEHVRETSLPKSSIDWFENKFHDIHYLVIVFKSKSSESPLLLSNWFKECSVCFREYMN